MIQDIQVLQVIVCIQGQKLQFYNGEFALSWYLNDPYAYEDYVIFGASVLLFYV